MDKVHNALRKVLDTYLFHIRCDALQAYRGHGDASFSERIHVRLSVLSPINEVFQAIRSSWS